ncbi:MAG: hypothetical protein Q8Q10_03265 [bacterium]|nr:hypothetical protein [bacterium]
MRVNTIIIANIAEAFEDIINKVQSPRRRHARIGIEHALCERALLWEGDNKIVVTPFPIGQALFRKNLEVFSFSNVTNFSPRQSSISLSKAIWDDKKLLKILIEVIRDNPGIEVSPYCITEKFLSLVSFFAQKNLIFSVKQRSAQEDFHWLVSYLDSKIGSRMEIGAIRHKSIRTPESVVCRTNEEIIDALTWFYSNKQSCVVKANFGESSWGTMILLRKRFKGLRDAIHHVLAEFKKDSIWQDGLILVEEYVESNGLDGVSPSAELYIDKHGPKIMYLCDQIFGAGAGFLGVALGVNVLSGKIMKRIKTASLQVGKRFWKMGYRGFFDIDFVTSKNGEPFIVETNMRRTGGTHVYDAARLLVGNNWKNMVFVLSQDSFKYGQKKLSEEKILCRMENILYPINGRKRGVIISIINKKQPTFGFIIIEKSRGAAAKMYNEILACWGMRIKH